MGDRTYTMQKRATAMAETRARLLKAAAELLIARWYDEVSLKDIAEKAGVSLSTLVRHFATKIDLVLALSETERAAHWTRDDARVGDIADAARGLVADYESSGDAVIRLLALEEKLPELSSLLDKGKQEHRAWVERIFAPLLPSAQTERAPIVDDLVVVLDVYAWKLWRRQMKKSQADTAAHMTGLVRLRLGVKR